MHTPFSDSCRWGARESDLISVRGDDRPATGKGSAQVGKVCSPEDVLAGEKGHMCNSPYGIW